MSGHDIDQTVAVRQVGVVALVVTVASAVVMAPLNSTMIAVALTSIREDLNVSTGWASWLIATYLIVMAVGQPISGRLGDMVGRRKLFIGGLLYFAVASALATVSWDFSSLVFFRVQQALGATAMMPNGMAMLRIALPTEVRGRAFGSLGAVISLSAAIGPALGGILVDSIGWRALFAINLPLIAVSLALALRYFPQDVDVRKPRGFDIPGVVLLFGGLVSLMVSATTLGKESATNPLFLGTGVAAVVSGGLFLWWEARHKLPIITLNMFRRRSYAAGASTVFLSNLSMYTLLIVVPLFLQDLRGESASRSGVTLISLAIFMVVLSPFSGWVADRVGRKYPAVFGALLLTLGAAIVPTWELSSSIGYIFMSLTVFGAGLGILSAPTQTAAIESCPPEVAGAASGTYSTSRYLGAIVGIGIVGALLSDGELTEISVFRNLAIVLAAIAGVTILSTLNIHRWLDNTSAMAGKRDEVASPAS